MLVGERVNLKLLPTLAQTTWFLGAYFSALPSWASLTTTNWNEKTNLQKQNRSIEHYLKNSKLVSVT